MKVDRRVAMAIGGSLLFFSMVTSICTIMKTKQRRPRRFGVRPINRNRDTDGMFNTLIRDMNNLEWDEEQFFKYSRMTRKQFVYLLQIVRSDLQKDLKKKHISPDQRLMITIHYLSEGCSMQEIAWGYRIGLTTAHKIIKETTKVLWDSLNKSQLPVPTLGNWETVCLGFYNRWNIPNCVGAVDGKHIVIQAPTNSGSVYFNYKKTFSIVLMATCDAYYKFTMIDIGAAGSNHDSAVFKESGLGSALMNGELDIPPPKNLPGTNLVLNHFLIGDSAFPLHTNIIRPYPGSNLGEKKNIFNYRVSRARRTIENTFGILSQRWRILHRPIVASVEVAEQIVQATVVLHNFLQNSEKDIPLSQRKYCPTGFGDYIDNNGELQLGNWRKEGSNLKSVNKIGSNNATNSAKLQRERLADYFVSPEGWLPWQENYVNRGGIPPERQ